jgi:hypothetical protein
MGVRTSFITSIIFLGGIHRRFRARDERRHETHRASARPPIRRERASSLVSRWFNFTSYSPKRSMVMTFIRAWPMLYALRPLQLMLTACSLAMS